MKQFIHDFKENKFFKLYVIFFSLINLIYTYFGISKSLYIQKYSLRGTIEKYQFEHLSNISKITNLLESLIILIYLVYLIKVIIKKDKMNIKHFLIFNFGFIMVLTSINYLVSVVFSVPFWPLTLLFYTPLTITLIFLIYF
ncbi:hypothetical protein, partial [Clostridium sp. Cult2]|uniref:hypothetical protein n=1 Tax=Clostridium sp. Cult2 TaxID=2079003 RepID=UPI001F37DB89